jgi:hypothetical protein
MTKEESRAIEILSRINGQEITPDIWQKASDYAKKDLKRKGIVVIDELIIQNGELYLVGLDGTYYREKNNFLFEVKSEIEKL